MLYHDRVYPYFTDMNFFNPDHGKMGDKCGSLLYTAKLIFLLLSIWPVSNEQEVVEL